MNEKSNQNRKFSFSNQISFSLETCAKNFNLEKLWLFFILYFYSSLIDKRSSHRYTPKNVWNLTTFRITQNDLSPIKKYVMIWKLNTSLHLYRNLLLPHHTFHPIQHTLLPTEYTLACNFRSHFIPHNSFTYCHFPSVNTGVNITTEFSPLNETSLVFTIEKRTRFRINTNETEATRLNFASTTLSYRSEVDKTSSVIAEGYREVYKTLVLEDLTLFWILDLSKY